MKEFKHIINDPMGMHARPAGMLVKAVAGYASKITITAPTGTADARRLMALMKLAAKQGMELTVTVDGAEILPLVGSYSPAIKRKSVDLPAPFLPTNAMRSLRLMRKVISSNTGLDENSIHI